VHAAKVAALVELAAEGEKMKTTPSYRGPKMNGHSIIRAIGTYWLALIVCLRRCLTRLPWRRLRLSS
jgi:hypothetical protein